MEWNIMGKGETVSNSSDAGGEVLTLYEFWVLMDNSKTRSMAAEVLHGTTYSSSSPPRK